MNTAKTMSDNIISRAVGNLDFHCEDISDLTRREIAECLRDLIAQYKGGFEMCCTIHQYGLRVIDIDRIRTLLFDYEVWLSRNSDAAEKIKGGQRNLIALFEWSRLLRRSLVTKK